MQVSELEAYIETGTPSKVSDMQPIPTASGSIQPWEFMFIHPKRSLIEERNGGICDVNRFIAVGRPDSSFIGLSIGAQELGETIFAKYGETDADRALTLESHSLRHLQNTELFRLGVADTIISKRFNRRSVAQSYEYDHRSLAEDLEHVELSPEIEIQLGTKAATVAKMIKTGKANGPIVDTFKRFSRPMAMRPHTNICVLKPMASTRPPMVTVSIALPWTRARSIWSASRAVGTFRRPIFRRIASISFDWRASCKGRWKPSGRGRPPALAGRINSLMRSPASRGKEILAADEGKHPFPNGPDSLCHHARE